MNTPVTTAADTSVKPLRLLFTLALLGYVALHLGFQFPHWILPAQNTTLISRSQSAGFLDLFLMAFPLLAVLIATHLSPQLPGSKIFALVALIEYAVAVVLGGVTFLIGLGGLGWVDTFPETIDALGHVVLAIARLGLVTLAGYAVLRVFLALGGRVTLPSALHPPA
ncbi:hypothetical protein ACFQZ4_39790 [Catellatospora coxensis]|uniref:Uncharacterized protein n=1 Tax=Catellatospora coxensis TaxID=310354 RepID=A0A8J3L5W2_9ACTN|nr:hypothetical protein [Catellatospora coxensis]GIG09714.1 hypothetical protein Cco03nite_64140 [Catellatospora coxensis]